MYARIQLAKNQIFGTLSIGYMVTEAPLTPRIKRIRKRRPRGVAMVASDEVGEGKALGFW